MNNQMVRIGIIGAGNIFEKRHLPKLAKLESAELVVVSNRSVDSARRVAEAFNIRDIEDNWMTLICRDDIDAVMIGTWPNMHSEMTIAAIQSGKHVFCQSPMARDLVDARQMLSVANAHPQQVSVICPSLIRMPYEAYVKEVIDSGKLGKITTVDVIKTSGAHIRRDLVHWHERKELMGKQILDVGAYAEVLNAWVGPYSSIVAVTTTPISTKQDVSGQKICIEVPQIVMISGLLESGAAGVEFHGSIVANTKTPHSLVTIYGTEGTLRYDFATCTFKIASLEGSLEPIEVPTRYYHEWQVEADFIISVQAAKSGQPWSKGANLDFQDALIPMQKVEALHISVITNQAVRLATL